MHHAQNGGPRSIGFVNRFPFLDRLDDFDVLDTIDWNSQRVPGKITKWAILPSSIDALELCSLYW